MTFQPRVTGAAILSPAKFLAAFDALILNDLEFQAFQETVSWKHQPRDSARVGALELMGMPVL